MAQDGVRAAWDAGCGGAPKDYKGTSTSNVLGEGPLISLSNQTNQEDFQPTFGTSADGTVRGEEHIMK
jgi:hypothetical protein